MPWKLNEKEEALVEELMKLTDQELETWRRTPRPFDPEINIGRVGLTVRKRREQ